jgi:hypothetical protein
MFKKKDAKPKPRKAEKMIRICPKCSSKNVVLTSMKGGRFYVCKNCSFAGSLFPEIPKKLSSMKRRTKLFTFKTRWTHSRVFMFLIIIEIIIIWALLVFR